MLASRRCLVRNGAFRNCFHRRSATSASQPAPFAGKQRSELGPSVKSAKQPFLKNVLLGRFDRDFLIYPEVVDLDELRAFVIENLPVEPTNAAASAAERARSLLRANVPIGPVESCNESERLKICELLDVDLPTALVMDSQSLVVRIVSAFGGEGVKAKYLSKLTSGEWKAAFAMSESATGSDPSALETNADYDETSRLYRIDGTKEWVTNGEDADVFVVLASSAGTHGLKRRDVHAFVVDRSAGGISWSAQAPRALDGCGIGRIRFAGCPVPEENLLGEFGGGLAVACSCMEHERFFVLTSLLNAMKRSFADANDVVKTRRQATMPLVDSELIRHRMAKIGIDIYCLESMLYWYTGMADSYDMDLSLESAALHAFCYDSALRSAQTCNELLGGRSFAADSPHGRLADEIRGVTLASKTQTLLRLYGSLMAVRHMAQESAKVVAMARNPFDYPGFAFKQVVGSLRSSRGRPKLALRLFEELHPSLQVQAELLEGTVLRTQWAAEKVLSRYGSDAPLKQVDMMRISDLLVDVFVMTAVLARASRSFCTGMQFCDQELFMAVAICNEMRPRVEQTIAELLEGGVVSRDKGILQVGTEFVNQGGYFVRHPLLRNIK